MRFIFTALLLISLSGTLKAPLAEPDRKYIMIEKEGPDPFLELWEALKMVESSNNPAVINETEQAYGVSQIRQIRLDDYYRRTGIRYTLEDCLDEKVSLEIFRYYYGRYDNWEIAVKRWNGSGRMTAVYLDKVKKELEKVENS